MRNCFLRRVIMTSDALLFMLLASFAHSHNGDAETTVRNSTRSAQRLQFNVEAINSTSLHVEWTSSSASENDIVCPTRHYVVRLRDVSSSSRIRSLRYDSSKTSAVVSGLRPGSVQRARLVVDTACRHGGSKASRWISVHLPDASAAAPGRITKSVRDLQARDRAFQRQTLLPGQPTSVRTRVIEPDTVLVSWQPPLDGGTVAGYMIGYGEGVPDVNWRYLEHHRRNVTIRNLKPATQYVVSVRAFNDIDKGPVIYDLVYTASGQESNEMVMAGPAPSRLRARPLSPTSVSLHWHDPSLGRARRIVDNRYYNIHYEATQPGAGKTMSVIVKDLSVVLHDLDPATRYEFKVRTVKDGLTSPFSNVVTAWTLDQNAAAVSRSSSSSRRDHYRAGEYSKARYRGSADDYDGIDTADTSDWRHGSSLTRDRQMSTDGGKVRREPGSVAAVRTVLASDNVTASHRQPEVRFGTLVLHRISVYITWPRDAGCSGGNTTTVVGYRLRYQAIDDANEFISRQLTDNFVLLENVRSNVRYRFQLKHLFADGSETEWSRDGLVDTTPTQRQTVTD